MRRPAFMVALVALVACVARGAVSDSSVNAVSAELAFGSIAPDAPAPSQKAATIVIRSAMPWVLTASLESDPATPSMPLRDAMEVRSTSGEWVSLVAGIPVEIASGEGRMTDAPAMVSFDLRVRSKVEAPPGPRRFLLRFAIVGQTTSAIVRGAYDVLRWTQLQDEARPFDSPHVDPARSGLYAYDRRAYRVRSNVPWTVDVTVTPLKSKGSEASLPAQVLVVIGSDGRPHPLLPAQPTVVAQGAATTAEGVVVNVQLAVRVDDSALPSGEYGGEIQVQAHGAGADARVDRERE